MINEKCENIDECKDDPCAMFSDCVDTDGSFNCNCKNGFFSNEKHDQKVRGYRYRLFLIEFISIFNHRYIFGFSIALTWTSAQMPHVTETPRVKTPLVLSRATVTKDFRETASTTVTT